MLLLGLANLLALGGIVWARGKADGAGETSARDPYQARRLSMVTGQIEFLRHHATTSSSVRTRARSNSLGDSLSSVAMPSSLIQGGRLILSSSSGVDLGSGIIAIRAPLSAIHR